MLRPQADVCCLQPDLPWSRLGIRPAAFYALQNAKIDFTTYDWDVYLQFRAELYTAPDDGGADKMRVVALALVLCKWKGVTLLLSDRSAHSTTETGTAAVAGLDNTVPSVLELTEPARTVTVVKRPGQVSDQVVVQAESGDYYRGLVFPSDLDLSITRKCSSQVGRVMVNYLLLAVSKSRSAGAQADWDAAVTRRSYIRGTYHLVLRLRGGRPTAALGSRPTVTLRSLAHLVKAGRKTIDIASAIAEALRTQIGDVSMSESIPSLTQRITVGCSRNTEGSSEPRTTISGLWNRLRTWAQPGAETRPCRGTPPVPEAVNYNPEAVNFESTWQAVHPDLKKIISIIDDRTALRVVVSSLVCWADLKGLEPIGIWEPLEEPANTGEQSRVALFSEYRYVPKVGLFPVSNVSVEDKTSVKAGLGLEPGRLEIGKERVVAEVKRMTQAASRFGRYGKSRMKRVGLLKHELQVAAFVLWSKGELGAKTKSQIKKGKLCYTKIPGRSWTTDEQGGVEFWDDVGPRLLGEIGCYWIQPTGSPGIIVIGHRRRAIKVGPALGNCLYHLEDETEINPQDYHFCNILDDSGAERIGYSRIQNSGCERVERVEAGPAAHANGAPTVRLHGRENHKAESVRTTGLGRVVLGARPSGSTSGA